jgi:hypothetical protein
MNPDFVVFGIKIFTSLPTFHYSLNDFFADFILVGVVVVAVMAVNHCKVFQLWSLFN